MEWDSGIVAFIILFALIIGALVTVAIVTAGPSVVTITGGTGCG